MLGPVQITRKKITDTRSRMQGYDDVAAARRREKLLKAAEYRLQHEQQRLSSKIAQNKALKDDVESLRRDRMQRLGIIDKVEAQLQSIRVSFVRRAGLTVSLALWLIVADAMQLSMPVVL